MAAWTGAFAPQSLANYKRYLFTIEQGGDNTTRRINVNSLPAQETE